ncbi:MAG: NADPH-dependent oxidoreductase [Candidatus Marinimicrobia bacterium]|nr:NADPH-dependent oxidoreductase [Candidatus Neomarinimicrobiota bacterium]
MFSNPVIETQKNHVTIRQFNEEPIETEMLEAILEAGRRAPTSSNMQAYSVIVIKDPLVKKRLSILTGDQKHVETCPVFLAFCADLNRLQQTCEMHDVEMTNNLETFIISTVDAALVGMSVQTGAESFGLGAVMIGAMRNSPREVADLLGLPRGVYVVYGMCLGWPEKSSIPPQKPRLPKELVIHHEKYSTNDASDLIHNYDKLLVKHYEALGRNLNPAAWSGVIARNLGRSIRPENLDLLGEMGFDICRKSEY